MKLDLQSVSKSFGDQPVLKEITLQLDDVRNLVLIGPSGGGKSTLLRILAGLETADAGQVKVNDRLLDRTDQMAHRRRVGTVFQAFNLFPHLSALRNITLPLEIVHQFTRAAAEARAIEVLERFQLGAHTQKRPAELSGGQRQRVAIARAVSIRPELLLFDEPTSALDPEMTAEVLDLIGELRAEGRDFVLVTHQMGFARRAGDRVAFLAGGRIVECGEAEQLFQSPESEQCRAFLSKVLNY